MWELALGFVLVMVVSLTGGYLIGRRDTKRILGKGIEIQVLGRTHYFYTNRAAAYLHVRIFKALGYSASFVKNIYLLPNGRTKPTRIGINTRLPCPENAREAWEAIPLSECPGNWATSC